jgi:hypothetical protein
MARADVAKCTGTRTEFPCRFAAKTRLYDPKWGSMRPISIGNRIVVGAAVMIWVATCLLIYRETVTRLDRADPL